MIKAKASKPAKTGVKRNSKLSFWLSPILFLLVFGGILAGFAVKMGLSNMLGTFMNTAFALLMDTCFYIMAIAVIMGAVAALLSEFGVVTLLNHILNPLMKPLYGLPGAAALGIVTTYLSDNPAILSLAEDHGFRKYFKKYQFYALTNLGTAFGMGIIVSTFMIGLKGIEGGNVFVAVLIGNLGAIIGSIVSTRLMLSYTKKLFGTEEYEDAPSYMGSVQQSDGKRPGIGMRVLNAALNGGKSGVEIGLAIIPGVLVVCTFVMMLTNGAPEGGYTGGAYEGVGLLPWLASKADVVLKPLFGFNDNSAVSVPITALGSAGAATSIVKVLAEKGLVNAHDIAVFTSMCMCWSGYLSTHASMMQALHRPELTGRAILSHTVGGLVAGISANWIFKLIQLIAG